MELKKGALDGNIDEKSGKKFADEENVAEAFLSPGKNGKNKKKTGSDKTNSKLLGNESSSKKFKEQEDNAAELMDEKQKNGPESKKKKGQDE